MRVIGGSARGRRLATPKGARVRPTADRVKEALFSILASHLGSFTGLRVLDVCAGSGNLGIEALSRGCSEALFIDNHRESADTIRQNLLQLGLSERGQVVIKEATNALTGLARHSEPFHLVFMDPPYRLGLAESILKHLESSPLITEETVIVAESAVEEDLPGEIGSLTRFDRRIYGDTALSFFQKGEPADHA
ncbi:MAG: 16S rRNA (guanine(966)-N(2))-methyltransferase RsmD [Desulfuromonadales bacterium]|nr:MAG: 16S rRNA (guanine(966)-N(2))-methyltransferase RsmD [Desulfuromonadales bacterium]